MLTLKYWRGNDILCHILLVPLLIKDIKKLIVILLLGIIRLPKLKLNSEQKAENKFVTRHIANAMLCAVVGIAFFPWQITNL